MSNLALIDEPRNGYARFAALRLPAHKRWLCEKYETARRVERGLSPKDFGYGYFGDPNFDPLEECIGRIGYEQTIWMLNSVAGRIPVTFFPTYGAQSKTEERLSLIELRDKIQNTSAASKDKLPWLKLCVFGDRRTDKNSLRSNANTEALGGIELDYDDKQMSFETAIDTLKRAKLMALVYTSARYQPETPKWRLLLPLSRLIAPERGEMDDDAWDELMTAKRAKLVARVNGLFGGVFDPASFTLSQSFYYGGVGENPSHRAVVVEGEYIDQRDDLDDGALGKGEEPRKEKTDNLSRYASAYTRFIERNSKKKPIDVEHLLANMECGHKIYSVHNTQLSVIAALLHRGVDKDEAIDTVLKRTMEVTATPSKKTRATQTKILQEMVEYVWRMNPKLKEDAKKQENKQELLQKNDENEERIVKQLQFISTTYGSDKWVEIGKALQSLHWKDGDNDWGLVVLNDWSKAEVKGYTNFADLTARWNAFGDDHGVTINKLLKIIEPVDLWAQREAPPLPHGLLPKVIENFAFEQAKLMGCDPAGLAMGALVVCCAVIPDRIKVQVKKHDIRWKESTRMWVAYEGPPSVQKSPMKDRVTEPLNRIDAELSKRFHEAKAAYEALEGEEKKNADKPRHERVRFEDVTPEAAQPILRDSPNGVLLVRDELSGWFGSIDKYSGVKGGGMDRGFWLQAFNGGVYSWDRVSRGSGNIPNLSICVLGGIQEEPLRKLVNDGVDDGLIQRLLIIMLRPAVMGTDEPQQEDKYDDLIERLYALRDKALHHERHFSEGAQIIRRQLEQQHLDLAAGYEKINKKLAAHIGKYKGLFARLCLLWHTIETLDDKRPSFINTDIAQRVAKFMNEFLLQHAVAFYIGLLGLSDQHDRLLDVGGYILAHKLNTLTTRDIQRGSRSMRGMEKCDTDRIFEQLEAYGWLERQTGKRFSDVVWVVNPEVHRLFAAKAKEELERRQREQAQIVASIPKGWGGGVSPLVP